MLQLGQQAIIVKGVGVAAYWSHTFSNATSANVVQRLGMQFLVGGVDINVNTLAYFGVDTSGSERVIIHRGSDGVAMTQADIPVTQDTWITSGVTPIVLLANTSYTVSHRFIGAARNVYRAATSDSYDPKITKTANVYGSVDVIPVLTTGNTYLGARFGWV